MGIDDELNNLRNERSVRHDFHEHEEEEAEDRKIAGWIEAIGPEELDRGRVMENLEAYGFDQIDQDDIVDVPIPTGSDTPYWKSEEDAEEVGERLGEIENSGQSFRPVEDVVLNELAEDDTEEA